MQQKTKDENNINTVALTHDPETKENMKRNHWRKLTERGVPGGDGPPRTLNETERGV